MVTDGRPTRAEGMWYGPRERVPPYLDGFLAKRKKTRCTRWSFPGLAHAATCDLGREDFVHGNGAADRKLRDQRLCNYRQDPDRALPYWRSSWLT
jgi:hypothetical protein